MCHKLKDIKKNMHIKSKETKDIKELNRTLMNL